MSLSDSKLRWVYWISVSGIVLFVATNLLGVFYAEWKQNQLIDQQNMLILERLWNGEDVPYQDLWNLNNSGRRHVAIRTLARKFEVDPRDFEEGLKFTVRLHFTKKVASTRSD